MFLTFSSKSHSEQFHNVPNLARSCQCCQRTNELVCVSHRHVHQSCKRTAKVLKSSSETKYKVLIIKYLDYRLTSGFDTRDSIMIAMPILRDVAAIFETTGVLGDKKRDRHEGRSTYK